MTETEHIKATNRVRVSAALTIMRNILPGEEYGIDEEKYNEIVKLMRAAEVELYGSYSVEK